MEIVTYGNVELLAGVLRGVAYMFVSGPTADLKSLLLVALGVGFIVALAGYALAPQKMVGWYWLASVIGVVTVLWIPRTDVDVVDRLCGVGGGAVPGSRCIAHVTRVPFVLAFVASVSSKAGDNLAEIFETTFQGVDFTQPDGYDAATGTVVHSYRANGLMFGNKLVREASRVTFPDPDFRFDIQKYLENCAGPDLTDGTIDPVTLRKSTDIWQTLKDGGNGHPGGNPARFTPSSTGEVLSCDAMVARLDTYMGDQVQAAQNMLGRRVNANANGAMSATAAETAVGGQLEQAFLRAQLGDASMSAAKLIRQSAFINAMAATRGVEGQRSNDPSAAMLGMAEAQAKISTNSGWITSAKVAEEAMPLIRNGLEAILYAGFPIVMLLMLLVTGRTALKLFTSYASALLWIQLWPVLYAVLNYMASAASTRHLAAAGFIPGHYNAGHIGGGPNPDPTQGLSLLTSSSIYENAISDMAVVGYLVLSIPVIAWSLVKGMDSLGAGALAGAGAFSAGSAIGSSQASTGNLSLGVTKMDDVQLSPHYSDANFSSRDSADWKNQIHKVGESGYSYGEARKSGLGEVGAQFAKHEADSLSMKASSSFEHARDESVAVKKALTSTLDEAAALSKGISDTGSKFDGHEHDKGAGKTKESDTTVTKKNGSSIEEQGGTDDKATMSRKRTDTDKPTIAANAGRGGSLIPGMSGSPMEGVKDVGEDGKGKETGHGLHEKLLTDLSKAKSAKEAKETFDRYQNSDGYKHSHDKYKKADDRIEAGLKGALEHESSMETALKEGKGYQAQADWTRTNSNDFKVGLETAIVAGMSDDEKAEFSQKQRTDPAAALRMVEGRAHKFLDNLYQESGGGLGTGSGEAPSAVELGRLPPSIEDGKLELTKEHAGDAASAPYGAEQVVADNDSNLKLVKGGQAGAGATPDGLGVQNPARPLVAQGGEATPPVAPARAAHPAPKGGAHRPAAGAGHHPPATSAPASAAVAPTEQELDGDMKALTAEADAHAAAAKALLTANGAVAGAGGPPDPETDATKVRNKLNKVARDKVPLVKTIEDGYEAAGDAIDRAVTPPAKPPAGKSGK